MKKLAFVTALLGAGIAAQAAQAATTGLYYYQNTPVKSSFTLSLSGACSGKITLPVTQVYYYRQYSHDGGVIERDGSEAYLDFRTSDGSIYIYGYNYAYNPGEKITESVKNDKLSVAFNINEYVYSYISTLASGAYDSDITCKDDGTLSQQLNGWSPGFSYYTTKYSGSLSHTQTVGESEAEYKAKFSAAGTLELPGQCTIKGELFGTNYSLVCAPPKAIKLKLVASAQGVSQPD